jgi:hypothetical protein
MVQPKPKRLWQPSELERRVGQAARLAADWEAARIPWPQLQEAREEYLAWEAFALWVRAIEDVEGDVPEWLADAVEKRCPGFLGFVAERKRQKEGISPFTWSHLEKL